MTEGVLTDLAARRELDIVQAEALYDPKSLETMVRRAMLTTLDVFDPEMDIELSAADAFICMCPVNGKRDRASVLVRYRPHHVILELESFRTYLETAFAEVAITHEDVASLVWHDLTAVLGIASAGGIDLEMTFDAVEDVAMTVRKRKSRPFKGRPPTWIPTR
jgi:NADPH-dependent 7-cyano-7-deazaguanine reductase QueF